MRQFEERELIDAPSVPTESGCRRSSLALPTQPSINNTANALNGLSHRSWATRKGGERVIAKSRVVTFRMDQATWDFMRQLVPYTRYKKASSFIREGIELLLKQEEEQPSGWTVGRPRRT